MNVKALVSKIQIYEIKKVVSMMQYFMDLGINIETIKIENNEN